MPLYTAQSVLSSLTCLLIYLTAKETFNKTAGIIALFISCFYVDMIWFSGVLMSETLGLFLLCAVVYLILLKRSPVLTGAIFGMACLTKGIYLITFPALLLWIFLMYDSSAAAPSQRPPAPKTDKKKAAWAAAKFALFTFLVISPWTVRNYYEYGGFVLLAPHDGPSIFIGHNPSATGGADFYFVDKDYGKWYTDKSLSGLKASQVAFKLAVDYAVNHPAREAQLFFLKLSKYWSLRTHFDMNNGPYPLKKTFFFLSILTHFLLLPACFLGAVFSLKNRSAVISTITICLNTLVFATLFFASGRMRFQLVPFIIILASYGFYLAPEMISRLRRSDMAGVSGRLTAAAAMTLLLYANFVVQILEKHADIAQRFH